MEKHWPELFVATLERRRKSTKDFWEEVGGRCSFQGADGKLWHEVRVLSDLSFWNFPYRRDAECGVQLPASASALQWWGRRKRCRSWQVVVVFLGRKTLECTPSWCSSSAISPNHNRWVFHATLSLLFSSAQCCCCSNWHSLGQLLADSPLFLLSSFDRQCLILVVCWVHYEKYLRKECLPHRQSNKQTASQGVDNKTQWKALGRKGTLSGPFSRLQNNLPFFFLVSCSMHSREAWDSQASWWELSDLQPCSLHTLEQHYPGQTPKAHLSESLICWLLKVKLRSSEI